MKTPDRGRHSIKSRDTRLSGSSLTTKVAFRSATMSTVVTRPYAVVSRRFLSLILVTFALLVIMLLQQTTIVDGFIKFGYILNTTACDTCDELRTYSGRNVFCCLAQSKCCGPNSLDELEAALTTVVPPAA